MPQAARDAPGMAWVQSTMAATGGQGSLTARCGRSEPNPLPSAHLAMAFTPYPTPLAVQVCASKPIWACLSICGQQGGAYCRLWWYYYA
mmetsp:Transcript_37300/g.66533  ORF Transcript_37300/g.66533 Transcript_37300/m.66533 type:complete len:89 (+) Transcript_37300:486-752(+)